MTVEVRRVIEGRSGVGGPIVAQSSGRFSGNEVLGGESGLDFLVRVLLVPYAWFCTATRLMITFESLAEIAGEPKVATDLLRQE
jgi:hypothetical protein